MKRIRHWFAHRFGWNMGRIIVWRARCGKEMIGFLCSSCGRIEGIRPVQLGKRLVPLLCLVLSGCVVREKVRIEYKQLPPQERIYFIVPDSAVPKNEPSEVEKNKEAQKFAISPRGEATGGSEI